MQTSFVKKKIKNYIRAFAAPSHTTQSHAHVQFAL